MKILDLELLQKDLNLNLFMFSNETLLNQIMSFIFIIENKNS